MKKRSPVFKENYTYYLEKIKAVSLEKTAQRLGAVVESDGIVIPLFGRPYRLNSEGVSDSRGNVPDYFTCVVLFKYVLMCPDWEPVAGDWVSFKDFRDAAPLVSYFSQRVEGDLTRHFAGRADRLASASTRIGGVFSDLRLSYTVAAVFEALPKIAVLVLFNDKDDEFPAACSVLFRNQAQAYLDMECVAGLGNRLSEKLIGADR
ncbi:MAG: DUF3786 domain-containing protein [Desulfobacterales bacterium]